MKNNRSSKTALILGLAILAVFAVAAFAPGLFTPFERKDYFDPWLAAGPEHPLGTNALGYDIFTELCFAAGSTLITGITAALLSVFLAILLGIMASGDGFFGAVGKGLSNLFVTLPKLICLIVLAGFLGSGRIETTLLICLFTWAPTARLIEARTRSLKESLFVENLSLEGFSKTHIAFHHILPNLLDIVFQRFVIALNSCIMMESTLSFLGIGDTYYPTWGTMVNIAYNNGAMMRGAYLYILAPGICIAALSLSFNLISGYIEERRRSI